MIILLNAVMRRDAQLIAKCLCYGGYHAVYIPSGEDDAVKEYLRMRDDHKLTLKKLKQQINAFALRHGHKYEGIKWTQKHLALSLHSLPPDTLSIIGFAEYPMIIPFKAS